MRDLIGVSTNAPPGELKWVVEMSPIAAVIIPAHNESSGISRTLQAVTQGAEDGELEVVVVCNGCTDDTASVASTFTGVDVIEIPVPSKLAALRAGDQRARTFPRIYLDADIELTTEAIRSIAAEFERPHVFVAGVPGKMDLAEAPLLVALFYEFRDRLPLYSQGIIGSGNYALSEVGRARFGEWPDLKSSDDGFIFRLFEPHERATVSGHKTRVLPPSSLRALVRRGVRALRGRRDLTAGAAGRPLAAPNAGAVQALRESFSSFRGALSAAVFVALTGVIRVRARLPGGSDWSESGSDYRQAAPDSPRCVSAVIVVFNAAPHLMGMLDSLRYEGNQPAQIIAIDNGSTDESLSLLESHDDVEVVAQNNTGFAHGVNRGISLARPDADILILNADVRLHPNALRALVEVLDRYPGVGIVAPRLVDVSGLTLRSCRRAPSIGRTIVDAVVGGTRAGRFGETYRPGSHAHEVDWATGAALLLRRQMLDEIGGLDESFFLYSEETELCLRASRRGFRIMVEPKAAVTHIGGEMGSDPRLWSLRAVNRVRRYRVTSGPIAGIGFRGAQMLFELRRALTGDPKSRAALRSLSVRDLDAEAARLTRGLGGDVRPMHQAVVSR